MIKLEECSKFELQTVTGIGAHIFFLLRFALDLVEGDNIDGLHEVFEAGDLLL